MSYNNFGATVDSLVALFPNADADELGGTAYLTALLERCARRVAAATPGTVQDVLAAWVEYELLQCGAYGWTEATLGIGPLLAGSLEVYRVPDDIGVGPNRTTHALAEYSLSGSTITLAQPVQVGERILARYRVDVLSVEFFWPSVADVVLMLAAFEAGSRIYHAGDAGGRWQLVDDYKAIADGYMAEMKAGDWLPYEMRSVCLWGPSASQGIGSVVMRR